MSGAVVGEVVGARMGAKAGAGGPGSALWLKGSAWGAGAGSAGDMALGMPEVTACVGMAPRCGRPTGLAAP